MQCIKFRFFEGEKYYYFSVPYMSDQMFHKLQDAKSDKRAFEQFTGKYDMNGKEIYELCP